MELDEEMLEKETTAFKGRNIKIFLNLITSMLVAFVVGMFSASYLPDPQLVALCTLVTVVVLRVVTIIRYY